MQYGQDYFGFVYLWQDTKQNKFIIGSHYGSLEDGYTTSTGGIYVKRIFKVRPESMKRRVLEYCKADSPEEVLRLEQKWLNLRPNIATNNRYYNLKQFAKGGIDPSIERTKPLYWIMGHRERQHRLVEEGLHNFTSEHARELARNRIQEGTHHFLSSDFNKKPFSVYLNGKHLATFESKAEAVRQGMKAGVIDRLRREGTYVVERGSYTKNSINELFLFKKNDILEYKSI